MYAPIDEAKGTVHHRKIFSFIISIIVIQRSFLQTQFINNF